jgi:hypothetical protein
VAAVVVVMSVQPTSENTTSSHAASAVPEDADERDRPVNVLFKMLICLL